MIVFIIVNSIPNTIMNAKNVTITQAYSKLRSKRLVRQLLFMKLPCRLEMMFLSAGITFIVY